VATLAAGDMPRSAPVPPVASPVQQRPRPLLLVPKTEPPAQVLRLSAVARPSRAVVSPVREVISMADREIVDAAVRTLGERAAEVAKGVSEAAKLPVDMVVEHGRITAELLAEALSRSNAHQIRRIASDLHEVQDLLMLMQLEKGIGPADDTLTLLLQIRRDLETILAA